MSHLLLAQKWISDEDPSSEEIENCLQRIKRAGADAASVGYLVSVLSQKSGVSTEEIEASLRLATEEPKCLSAELDLSPLGGSAVSEVDSKPVPIDLDQIPGLVRAREIQTTFARSWSMSLTTTNLR